MEFETTWGPRRFSPDDGWTSTTKCPVCGDGWSLCPEDVDGLEQAEHHSRLMFELLGVCPECRPNQGIAPPFSPPPPNRAERRAARRRGHR